MDQTPNRGYPFPECDPPLTKDASDIIQLAQLANAVDADVQSVYDRASDTVVRPDAARMSMTAAIASTDVGDLTPFFNSRTIDTTGSSMTPLAEGLIRLPEPGWYSVGAYAEFVSTTYLGLRICFTQNGLQASSYSTQAEIGQGNAQIAHHSAEIFAPTANNTVSITMRIGASSASYTYAARIWASQVVKF